MKKAFQKSLSVFLALVLTLSLMPALELPAAAASNHAPTAANTSVVFPSIAEDDRSNTGIPVSQLLSLAGASDADGNQLSIAVTSVDDSNGMWDIYYDKGWWNLTRYKDQTKISDSNVYLVPNGCSIKFLPDADFNGQAFITFRVWDETTGTEDNKDSDSTVDASGSNNDGSTAFSAQTITASITVASVNDAPEIHKTGLNNAINFDGTNDYVQAAGDLGLNDDSFTVEGWIKVCASDYSATSFSRFFDFANDTGENSGYDLWAGFDGTTGNLEFEAWDGPDRPTQAHAIKTEEQLPLNTWKYVSVVYNSSNHTGYIYWDGVLKASGNIPLTDNATRTRQYSYFGRSLWTADKYFDGEMRNISVWKEARTASEVASDMNANFGGSENNLVLYYPVADTVDSTTVASTTGSYNGSLMEYSSGGDTVNGGMIVNDDAFDYQVSGFVGQNIPVDQMYLKDVDAGAAGVSLTLSTVNGTLTVNDTDGVTITGSGSSSLALSGAVDDINAALRTLTYHSASSCTDTLTADVTDGGNTGAGDALSASETIGVTVSAVPDGTPSVQPPVSQTVTPGETATFSVTASGAGTLSYQWQKSTDGGTTWADISGATSDSYTTPATAKTDNGSQYRCYVYDSTNNTSVLSDKATLTISYPALKMAKASPANGATGVSVDTTLSMTFNEAVTGVSGKYIHITDPSETDIYKIAAVDVSVSDSTVTVTLPGKLKYTTKYHVLIDAGAFKDDNGTDYDGLSDTTAWCFTTTAAPDTTAPTMTGFTPSNGALSVSTSTQLIMTFSEPVTAMSGKNITVYKASDNSVVQTVSVTGSNVAVSGNAVTVTLPESLGGSTQYYVLIDSGAFTDIAGNSYAGISSTSAWSFTTADASAMAPGLTLGTATGTGPYYYSTATVTGSNIKTILLSFSESVKDGDLITLPKETPAGFRVSSTSASNNYTKRINIDTSIAGTDDAAAVQAYIQGIGFTLDSSHASQSVKVTVTTVDVHYDTFYDVDTQHYYQYVPYSGSYGTWKAAYTAAESMTYMGRTGYLATITSYDEDVFINSLSNGSVGWLGGTALTNTGEKDSLYYSDFNAEDNSGSNWYWADGPELGEIFYVGRDMNRSSSGTGENPYYWNWGKSTEPNGGGTSNENCLTTLVRSDQDGSRGTKFSWNDISEDNFKGNLNDFTAVGYFVEFGNLTAGSNETVDTRYASVTGTLSSSASTYAASISGVTVSGQTLTASLSGGTAGAYQWMRGDAVISGATAATYTLTDSDVGSYISVKITTSDTPSATVQSPQVGPVVAKPTLVATADNTNNCVKLHWTAGGDHYMVYQKDSGEEIYQSIPVSTDIKVLNVYPDGDFPDGTGDSGKGVPLTATVNGTTHSSDDLKIWMMTYGSPLVNKIQYNMALTQVALSTFKSNPSYYLGTPGNYNYDVVFFGSWDCNGGNLGSGDLNAVSETAMEQFIKFGGGCLAGHDTSINTGNGAYYHPYFNTLMNLFNITLESGSGYGETDTAKTCVITVAKKGLLTNYPYQFNSTLTVPACHTSAQVANGDIWMRFSGDVNNRNFYLTTWNNTAMIQTGHSNGAATTDEQEIITNTLYYLAQVTQSTSSTDHTAQDLAGPNAVDSSSVMAQSTANSTTLSWTGSSDNGSTYDYYVREFPAADSTSHVDSAETSATVTTGVKGYYVLVDQNESATADAVKTANHFVTANTYTTATSSLTAGTNYVHIIAVDNADNESAVTTKEITVNPVSPVAGSGSALSFNGTDYVAVPANSAYITANFTVETWVQYSADQSYSGIVDKGRNTGKNWYILSSDGANNRGVVVGMQGAGELGYNWNDNNWHYVCISCDGTNFRLYVDGIQRGSKALSGYTPANSTITFGRRTEEDINSGDHLSYYTGNLDEVKLWNTARMQEQIQSDMYSHSVSESGLVGYWSFDEGPGTTATDLTGNKNNGKLTNMDSSAWVDSPAWQNRVTTENTPLVIDAGYTWDSNAVTLAAKTGAGPMKGTLAFDDVNKTVTYTPTSGYSGTDTFTYSMTENGISKDYTVNMTVVQKPFISTQPATQTVAEKSPVSFKVEVTTPPNGTLTYQWQEYDGTKWNNIDGATDATYTINTVAAGDAGQYQCIVTNTYGATTLVTTSDAATLTVTFTAMVNVNLDGTASDTPVGAGVVLKYSGSSDVALTKSTDGTYTANVVNGTYDVYVNGADTGTDIEISNTANSVTVNYYTVSFSVSSDGAASGSTISATYNNKDVESGDIVRGGKTLVLNVTGEGIGEAQSSSYACVWSGEGTNSATGTTVTITSLAGKVDAACTVTGSATYAVTLNKNGGSISSGNVTAYTYGTGATLPTSGNISKAGYVFGGWYATSDFQDNTVTSIGTTDKGAKIFYAKWVQSPVMTGPSNVTAAEGSEASFSVTVSAPTTGLTYQWKKSTDGGTNWSTITGATGATYVISNVAATDAGQYQCVVTNTDGMTATTTSNTATLTVTFLATVNVNLDGSASDTPVGTSGTVKLMLNNTEKATFTKSATGTYTTNIVNGTYDVYVNGTDTGTDIEISNTANSVTVNYYTVSFSVSSDGAASGSTISATYNNKDVESGDIVRGGKTLVLNVTGEGIGEAQSSSYACVWSGEGTNSATGTTVTITSLAGKVDAACTVTGSATYAVTLNKNGGSISSGNVTAYTYGTGATLPTSGNISKAGYVFGGWYATSDFQDNTVTSIGTTDKGAKTFYAKWVQSPVMTGPSNVTAAEGSEASFSVTVSVPTTGLTYQWQKSTDGGTNWSTITGATGATYVISNVAATDAGQYQCVVTNTDGMTATTTSNAATLTVTFTATVNVNLDGSASDTPVGAGVVLKYSGSSDVALTKSTDGTYTANVVNGTYDVYVNGADTGTDIEISNTANSVTVNYYTVSFSVSSDGAASGSTISATYNNKDVESGDIVRGGKTLVLNVTGEGIGEAQSSSYACVWSGEGTTEDNASGQGTDTLTISSLSSAVNAACTVTGSASYKVMLNANYGTVNKDNVTVYTFGTGATLPTDVTRFGYVFGGWYPTSDFQDNTVTSIGTTDKGAKTFYAKWVQNPAIGMQPVSQTIAEGAPVSFTVSASVDSGTLSYQWQKYDGSNWSTITGATGATYTIASVKAADAGQYQCVVTNTDGVSAATTSNAAALAVTFTAKVTIDKNGSSSPNPVTGNIELKQGTETKATLSGSNGVYSANVVNGTYDIYVNGQNVGQTITINNAASNTTINYYTVSFSVTDAGTASGSSVKATVGGTEISSGAIVLKGKTVVLTATGIGADYYAYIWSGSGTKGQDTNLLTISSLSGKVDATCTVTGRTTAPTYSVSLNTNGGSITIGSITSYTYGMGTALPTNVTREGFVFDGWFDNPDFSGNAVTEISNTDMGDKAFYAKWRYYTVGGEIVDDHDNPLQHATVTIRGNNIVSQSKETDSDGKYSFSNIPKGEYNIIATYNGVTTTIIISVMDADISNAEIVMPSAGAENSIVTIAQNTPDVVVGYLDQQFTDDDDTYVGTSGNTVKIELAVEQKSEKNAENDGTATEIQSAAGGRTVDMYLDMALKKTMSSSSRSSTKQIPETDSLLKIIIPYDLSGKTNIKVYRVHEDTTEAMMEKAYSTDTQTSECFMVDTTDNQIIVWAQRFSTYAIAYSNISYDSGSHTINASAGTGGSISPSGSTSVTVGTSKTFTITANDGYAVSDVLVDGKSVGAVGSYTFTNVTSSHTISAVFAKAEGLPYYLDGSGNKVFIGFASDKSGTMKYIAPKGVMVQFTPNPKSFTDISGHWAQSYINFVTQREIFVGTAPNVFSPDTGMTRAMFATVIGRLYERSYGSLVVSGTHSFTDCDYDSWYGSYIDWCSENGIIEGIGGGLYKPDRDITREEMAAILYRFVKFVGASSVDYATTQLAYPDAARISGWATDAAKYCEQTGIIVGRDNGYFVPQGTATRAEVTTILERFIEVEVK